MEKNYVVNIEKLDKLLEAIRREYVELAEAEYLTDSSRARYRTSGAEIMLVQNLITDPDFFTSIWDMYMRNNEA